MVYFRQLEKLVESLKVLTQTNCISLRNSHLHGTTTTTSYTENAARTNILRGKLAMKNVSQLVD
jgi:hypothetical protein